MSEVEVKDHRPGVFYMQDVIYDVYAPTIGVHAVAVYGLLCRRANSASKCWPSLNRMAKDLGISRPTVVKALDTLEHQELISRERQIDESGNHSSTIYTLLNPEGVVNDVNKGCKGDLQGVVNDVDTKDYTVEGQHNEGSFLKGNFDEVGKACAKELLRVSNFPKTKIAETLGELRSDYPSVDALKVCKDYRVWCEESPYKRPRSGLRTFFSKAEERMMNGQRNGSRAKPTPEPVRVKPESRAEGVSDEINAIYEEVYGDNG